MRIIYGLYDPSTCDVGPPFIRYVGYTSNVKRRFRKHITEAKKGAHTHRYHWIRELLSRDVAPCLIVMEVVTSENWRSREIFWISQMRHHLVNSTGGGEGSLNPSEDVRRRIGAASSIRNKGHTHNLGRVQSDDERAMRSEIRRRLSIERPELDDKRSASMLGIRWITDGNTNQRLAVNAIMPDGWQYGRVGGWKWPDAARSQLSKYASDRPESHRNALCVAATQRNKSCP